MGLYTSGAPKLFPLLITKGTKLSHKEAQKSQTEIINLLCAVVAEALCLL
jgi:hypothetical protein